MLRGWEGRPGLVERLWRGEQRAEAPGERETGEEEGPGPPLCAAGAKGSSGQVSGWRYCPILENQHLVPCEWASA